MPEKTTPSRRSLRLERVEAERLVGVRATTPPRPVGGARLGVAAAGEEGLTLDGVTRVPWSAIERVGYSRASPGRDGHLWYSTPALRPPLLIGRRTAPNLLRLPAGPEWPLLTALASEVLRRSRVAGLSYPLPVPTPAPLLRGLDRSDAAAAVAVLGFREDLARAEWEGAARVLARLRSTPSGHPETSLASLEGVSLLDVRGTSVTHGVGRTGPVGQVGVVVGRSRRVRLGLSSGTSVETRSVTTSGVDALLPVGDGVVVLTSNAVRFLGPVHVRDSALRDVVRVDVEPFRLVVSDRSRPNVWGLASAGGRADASFRGALHGARSLLSGLRPDESLDLVRGERLEELARDALDPVLAEVDDRGRSLRTATAELATRVGPVRVPTVTAAEGWGLAPLARNTTVANLAVVLSLVWFVGLPLGVLTLARSRHLGWGRRRGAVAVVVSLGSALYALVT